MQRSIRLSAGLAAVLTALAAGPSLAATPMMQAVRVEDGAAAAVQGQAQWPQVKTELSSAIAQRLGGRRAPGGMTVEVRLSDAAVHTHNGMKGPALAGTVLVERPLYADPGAGIDHTTSVSKAYRLTVTPQDAAAYMEHGETGMEPHHDRMLRQAMVKSFADYVVAHL